MPKSRPDDRARSRPRGDGDAQGLLFDGDFSPLPADLGFRGPIACNAAGITYRQLDYWARTGLVVPEVRGASGSGSQRLYSFRDILMLKVIKRLLDAGISLNQIRAAIEHLRARGVHDLTEVTLMSDGVSVFECTSDDEVIDLLRGGQGVFGIALGWGVARHRGHPVGSAGRTGGDPGGGPPPAAATSCPAGVRPGLSAEPGAEAGIEAGRVIAAGEAAWERPPGSTTRCGGAEGATSPEPLRHPDRAAMATLKPPGDRGGPSDRSSDCHEDTDILAT